MRAIDAEELKRSIAVSALIDDQKTLEQIIDEQPTIEERKKGKWIQSEEKEGMEFTFYEIHCSECGVLRKIGWTGANFCPNCGADMRG